jgi:hypothetical protein
VNAREPNGELLRMLADLPAHAPTAAHASRVRACCHEVLARQRTQIGRARQRSPDALELTAALALGAYLIGAISEAVRLSRLL